MVADLTHNPPDRWVGPGAGGTAVTGGIESALGEDRAVMRELPSRTVGMNPAGRVH